MTDSENLLLDPQAGAPERVRHTREAERRQVMSRCPNLRPWRSARRDGEKLADPGFGQTFQHASRLVMVATTAVAQV